MALRYKIALLIGILLSLYLIPFISMNNTYEIKLKDDVFCIAKGDDDVSVLDQSTGNIFQILGSDNDSQGGFQVILSPELVKEELSSYKVDDGGLPANLVINIKSATDNDLEQWLSGKSHQNVLRQQADFSESHVSYDSKSENYRVSWSREPPPYVIWHVIDRKPSPELKVPELLSDYYIGYCSRAGGINGISSNCQFYERYKKYFLTITTSEVNLSLKADIISLSKDKLYKWSRSCLEKI